MKGLNNQRRSSAVPSFLLPLEPWSELQVMLLKDAAGDAA